MDLCCRLFVRYVSHRREGVFEALIEEVSMPVCVGEVSQIALIAQPQRDALARHQSKRIEP